MSATNVLRKSPTRVYVAGPYSRPNPNHNTFHAVQEADWLWRAGYAPYCPHLSHFWDTMFPHPYEDWLELDIWWLEQCDVVYRMPGASEGADKEVEHAKALGIPVVTSRLELGKLFPRPNSLAVWQARNACGGGHC